MLKRVLLLAGTALLVTAPAYAKLIPSQGPTLTVQGTNIAVPYDASTGKGTLTGYQFTQNGNSLNVNANTDADPFAILSVAFTDNGAPDTFSGLLITPISPLTGKIQLVANAAITGNDNVANPNGGTLTPALVLDPKTYSAFDVNGDIKLALVTDPISYGNFGSGFKGDNGTITVDCALLPGGKCASLSIAFGVNGAGGGDQGSVLASVSVSQTPVAEPMTLALLGMGLAGLGFVRRAH